LLQLAKKALQIIPTSCHQNLCDLLTKKKRKATEGQKNGNCFCIVPTENPITFVPMSSTFQGREEAFLNRPKIALKISKVEVSIVACILCLSIKRQCVDVTEDIEQGKFANPLLSDCGMCYNSRGADITNTSSKNSSVTEIKR